MKIKARFNIALFILAVLLALFALETLEAKGQTPNASTVPPGLPQSLPMFSSTNAMIEWIVTNHPVYCNVTIHYTRTNGSVGMWGNTATPSVFSSYGVYQNFVTTNTSRLLGEATDANPTMPLWMSVSVVDATMSQPYAPMLVLATNSSFASTTTTWVSNNLTPSYMNLCVPVLGLQQFTFSMTSPSYLYAWNNGAQPQVIPPPPVYPPEKTTTGWLVLNPWYCLEQYRARFTVTANGVSQVYTQTGAPLLPGSLTSTRVSPSSVQLQVSSASGSDLTIQSSSVLGPLANWQQLVSNAWSSNTGAFSVIVTNLGNQGFFRVRSD